MTGRILRAVKFRIDRGHTLSTTATSRSFMSTGGFRRRYSRSRPPEASVLANGAAGAAASGVARNNSSSACSAEP